MSNRRGAPHQAISTSVTPCLSTSGCEMTDFVAARDKPDAGPVSETGAAERARAAHNVLPPGALPRGLSRVQAAAYVGVSPTTFDRMVKDRLMPKPKRIYGRTVWDVRKIDVAFAALDGSETVDDPWDKMAL